LREFHQVYTFGVFDGQNMNWLYRY